MDTKPFVSRCTGRIPLPSDPNAPWPPELLEKLFPKANRSAWNEVVAVAYEQHNAEVDIDPKAG